MGQFQIDKSNQESKLKIVCVGVGGAGCNAIELLANKDSNKIDFIALDADAKSLEHFNVIKKIQIGTKTSKGLGSGMKSDIGRECAIESYDAIKEVLEKADMVLLIAGFGGGTGTGAAPIIAKIAKEVGALTISIITMPFVFEGTKRVKIAEGELANIKRESDSVIIIQNEKILPSIDRKLGIFETFKTIDTKIAEAINGIVGVVLLNGENDINLDFADLKTIMNYKGMALMGVGDCEGENSADGAINLALKHTCLQSIPLQKANGILINFYLHPDFPSTNIYEAMDRVYSAAHIETTIIFGVTTDETLPEEYVKVIILLNGFEINRKNLFVANNNSYEG